jgi:hypothetical protein
MLENTINFTVYNIMSTYESNIRPIDSLFKALQNWIDEDSFYKTIKTICDGYDKKWQKDLYQDHYKKSLVRKLLQTHERMELTDHLMKSISSDFITRYEYPKLITYLRLTCFDLLGQPSDWMIYSDWITSKSKEHERDAIIGKISYKNELEFAYKTFDEYQQLYGVKNSFFRFLNEILPKNHRNDLLNHINIRIEEGHTNIIKLHETTLKDKENYLFTIRNDYTHKVYGTSGIHGFKSKYADKDWHFRETIYKNNFSYWVSTSVNFDEKLREIVYIGIAEIIKNHKK